MRDIGEGDEASVEGDEASVKGDEASVVVFVMTALMKPLSKSKAPMCLKVLGKLFNFHRRINCSVRIIVVSC
jgi:hypothetical protein